MTPTVPVNLLEGDAEAELRWKDLDDAGLDTEITSLRDSIRDTSERLLSLGVTPDWDADQSQSAAVRDGTDAHDGNDPEGDQIRYAIELIVTMLLPSFSEQVSCSDLQTWLS